MNNQELSNKLTQALSKLAKNDRQRLENKIYIVGGKPYRLIKEGNCWHRVEIKGKANPRLPRRR